MNSTRNKSVDLIYLLYNNPHTVFRLRDVALLTGESDPLRLGQRLNYYVRTGRLLNPRKGIYAKEGYNPEELSNILYSPSYLSLEYVLQKAGVVFQCDSRLTAVSYLSRSMEIDGRSYRYRKLKNEIIVQTKGIRQTGAIHIATAERAFLDMLYLTDNYCFDNLSLLDRGEIEKLLPIYGSKSLCAKVSKCFDEYDKNVDNMKTAEHIWPVIHRLTDEYRKLNLTESIDYRKFYIYSIITHSTAIEGSTLTESETQMLFDEGIAAGKPMVQNLMNLDLKSAYEFATEMAERQNVRITPELLRRFNALVMKSTGGEMSTMGGTFNTAAGDFRLCGVTAGYGGKSYMNYQKVPQAVESMCKILNDKLAQAASMEDIYNLSFDAHLNLVTIHPWADGNGRTARLLMNYIQFCHSLIPTKIHRQDREAYIKSLQESQDREDNRPFRDFMASQHAKTLKEEIDGHKKSNKKSFRLMF